MRRVVPHDEARKAGAPGPAAARCEGFFKTVRLSPDNWPVQVFSAMAHAGTFGKLPRFPRAATPEEGRMGHGRGADAPSARAGALFEMVEIASCCAWGDEPVRIATSDEVGGDGWSFGRLLGFADGQLADRLRLNGEYRGVDRIPRTVSRKTAVGWLAGERAGDGATVWLSADFALVGGSLRNPRLAGDSNGCAAGSTLQAAKLAALCELVERDATGRWWYGGRARGTLDPRTLGQGERIESFLAGRNRSLGLVDITSDLSIPTVAAYACDSDGRRILFGFSTRLREADAACGAVAELLQMELRLAAGERRPEILAGLEYWFEHVELARAAPFALAGNRARPVDARCDLPDLDACLAQLESKGIEVAFVDMTREAFGVPVVRAVSPDLCHYKPRFGKSRLLAPDDRDLEQLFTHHPNPVVLRV